MFEEKANVILLFENICGVSKNSWDFLWVGKKVIGSCYVDCKSI